MTVKAARFQRTRISLAVIILSSLVLSVIAQSVLINPPASVHAQPVAPPSTIAPSTVWGPLFSTSTYASTGDVEIDVNRPGIAVRVEIPREFIEGNQYEPPVISTENDTHFIESNIRNDYYYYSVVDESNHWTYDWRGAPSDGPCFKPNFSLRDPNAPWCVEIWNYLNDPNYRVPMNGFDYCANKYDNGTAGPPGIKYVFSCFSAPKFIRFHNLNAPSVAGIYNFTLFVANQTNSLGYPDFVDAWNTTLHVPVSMRDRPASISGTICDAWFTPRCPTIKGTKGIVYAQDSSGQIVARSFVNDSTGPQGGEFNITGLAPGSYQILGSAGLNPAYDVAYSLTTYPCGGTPACVPQGVTVGVGDHASISLGLNRAPQVCGLIDYQYNGAPLVHPLTDPRSHLPSIGLKVLNITVEAFDPQQPQEVYRNITLSQNNGEDSFTLITGSNVTYVGTDPYGTEFAGLPPSMPFSSSYSLNLNVWITGYVQVKFPTAGNYGSPETVTATVSASPLPGGSTPCPSPSPNPVTMQVGGVISGTIQLYGSGESLETPDQAESRDVLFQHPTDALFGGNILIEALGSGVDSGLRGVAVLNGTLPDGRTCYANSTLSALCKIKVTQVTSSTGIQLELPFTIIGFSEYLNHTWSGVWGEKDYGLPPDPSYSVQVYINGYALNSTNTISVALGQNATMPPSMMRRGGAFQIGVTSYDNRFGTRALQAPQTFQFLNLEIPVRARTYFYDSSLNLVGYVECIIRTGVAQPDKLCRMGLPGQAGSEQNSFTVIFAGQNWSLRGIWFYGDTPTHVGSDIYTIKTYTLGYVWPYGPSQAPNDLLGFAQLFIPLLIGNEISITGPVFGNLESLGTLPENDYAIGQALLNGGLQGALPANLTEGTPTFSLPIFGFGAMINTTQVMTTSVPIVRTGDLEGQGHFFYVAPFAPFAHQMPPTHFACDSPPYFTTNCYFDYGLDNGTYTAQVPEFGFSSHFMQPVPPSTITFNDLFLETGVVMEDIQMGRVVSDPLVTGWANLPAFDIAPLTWVQVTASNSTFTRTVTTLDGRYAGPGALFLPAGTYDITFSQTAYYTSQTHANLQVQWGSQTPIDPPNGPLCPILPPATSCGP